VAQPDDDAVAVGEVDRRMDHEERLLALVGDQIELRPVGVALARRRVEQHDRRVGIERRARVRESGQVRRRHVEAVDLHHDRRAGAPAIGAILIGGSMCVPAVLAGSDSATRASRRPVGVVPSSRVK
jgi:hypothetical protein